MVAQSNNEPPSPAGEIERDDTTTQTAANIHWESLVGDIFAGTYRIESLLGEGAMGVVFKAWHSELCRHVALKLMKDDSLNDTSHVTRFETEVRIVASLNHPNIVRIFDSGYARDHEVYYVAMELVEGECLGDLLQTRRCNVALALEITREICRGLTEPHSKQIVHRDLKPDNIMIRLRSDGSLEVKILDFGIARALRSNSRMTQTGMVMGTPSYMAPELAIDGKIDARTDLYAVGVMLFELLTGRVPHEASRPVQVLLKHINDPIPRLTEIDDTLDLPTIQGLIDSLTHKDIESRAPSALGVSRDIQNIQNELGFSSSIELDPELGIARALEPLLEATAHADRATTSKPPSGDLHEELALNAKGQRSLDFVLSLTATIIMCAILSSGALVATLIWSVPANIDEQEAPHIAPSIGEPLPLTKQPNPAPAESPRGFVPDASMSSGEPELDAIAPLDSKHRELTRDKPHRADRRAPDKEKHTAAPTKPPTVDALRKAPHALPRKEQANTPTDHALSDSPTIAPANPAPSVPARETPSHRPTAHEKVKEGIDWLEDGW